MSAFNQATPRLRFSEYKSDENFPPLTTDEELQLTPCFERNLKRFRSAPVSSPLFDLSDSFVETQRQLHRSDSFWNQVTPGAIRFKRRKLFDGEMQERSNRCLLDMPNEVIDHVMSFLNKRDLLHVGAACKRLYFVSSSPIHWTSLDLTGKTILDSSLHRILTRKTKALALMHATINNDRALLTHDFPFCPLVKVDLSWAHFQYPAMLNSFLRRFNNLEYLGLQNQALDLDTFKYIAMNKNLKVLNICNRGALSAEGLSLVFKNCPLIELNVSWCMFSPATAEVIINEIPQTVRNLAIAGAGDCASFGDEGMGRLIDRLPHLMELDAGDNNEISTAFITKLNDSAPHLRVLTVSRCFNVDPVAYCMLSRLRVLNIFKTINAQGYAYLRTHMPKTSLNENHLQTIAMSKSDERSDTLWNERVKDLY